MSLSSGDVRKLCDLFAEIHDGDRAPLELAWLEGRLKSDADARRLYVRYMRVCAGLSWDLRELVSGEQIVSAKAIRQLPTFGQERRLFLSPLRFLGSIAQTIQASPRLLLVLLNAALAGYFVVLFALIPLARFALSGRADRAAALKDDDLVRSHKSPKETELGLLTTDDQARWSNGSPQARKVVRLGERYELESGYAEVTLRSGVCTVIQGPAAWEFASEGRLLFDSGKLAARVPKRAIGFTIATATTEIVDLGTEFGVQIGQDGATDVHVLKGKVALRPGGRTADVSTREIVLNAGNARRVGVASAGQRNPVQTIPASPESFTRHLPPSGVVTVQSARASSKPLEQVANDWVSSSMLAGRTRSFDMSQGIKTATFDKDVEDWFLMGGTGPSWVHDNLTKGQGQGEVGGLFSYQGDDIAFLADASLGGTFTLDDSFSGSGEIYVGSGMPFSNATVGYLGRANNMKHTVGIQIADNYNTDKPDALRFFAAFVDSRYIRSYPAGGPGPDRGLAEPNRGDGNFPATPETADAIYLNKNTAYRFEFSYDPKGGAWGRLTARVFDSTGVQLGADSIYELSPEERGNGASLTVFGVKARGEVLLDNAAYTTWVSKPTNVAARGLTAGEYVIFDLGRMHRLDGMKLWADLPSSNSAVAVQLDIYVSSSGEDDPLSRPESWNQVVADHRLQVTESRAEPNMVSLKGARARFLALVVPMQKQSNPNVVHQGRCLSEVQFFGQPDNDANKRP